MVTSADKEGGMGKIGVGDYEVQTSVYKIISFREYSPYFINNYKWNITFKNCEPLRFLPVTYIILYISCTSSFKNPPKMNSDGRYCLVHWHLEGKYYS